MKKPRSASRVALKIPGRILFFLLLPFFLIFLVPSPSPALIYFSFTLEDFYKNVDDLDAVVDTLMRMLTDEEKIAQMVLVACGGFGKTFSQVLHVIEENEAGGVIFLGDKKEDMRNFVLAFTEASSYYSLLLPLYAVDAEPSLINDRIYGIPLFPEAGSIKTVGRCREVAQDISDILTEIGIHVNYAPVCDYASNNAIIGNRSFGSEPEMVTALTRTFIQTMQDNNIVATAKHFPGHGTVEGDTHWDLVVIDGEPPEIPIFRSAIDSGVVSVMVGHLAVVNHSFSTQGRPSTLSPEVVAGLLKGELGFRGIVVTDALNMEPVKQFELPAVQAVRAGCDMILMPESETDFIHSMLTLINKDSVFREQVMESVRKIVRLKVCLGLINYKRIPSIELYSRG